MNNAIKPNEKCGEQRCDFSFSIKQFKTTEDGKINRYLPIVV